MTEITVTHEIRGDAHVLLDFTFAAARPEAAGTWVGLRPLRGRTEQWLADQPVACADPPLGGGDWVARRSGDLLALSAARPATAQHVARRTEDLYVEAVEALRAAGFPHLVRVWNYVPEINRGEADDEVYRRFCVGRGAAIRRLELGSDALPAASALGSAAGQPLQVVFLASREPVRHLENPRQVSAYHYPRRYGAASPAFARATLLGTQLLISGTASIIGHESRYPGDVDRQLRCTLDNLLVLLDHARAEADARCVRSLHARVYLRRSEDLERVREALASDLPGLTSAIFLEAEICRRELLLEIEAVATLS